MATLTRATGEESLQVYVRVRPPILKEVQYESSVIVQGDNAISIISENREASCSYDHVFHEITSQDEVFQFVKPCLVDVLSGINSCIFAYGQTSSGKSYTMIGPNGGVDILHCDKDAWGILPRASEFLMGYLQDKASEGLLTYEVKVSFLQIYNENLYDLLRDSGPAMDERLLPFEKDREDLKIREALKPRSKLASTRELPKEVYVSGLSEFRVETSEDILKILTIGTANRLTRSTDFNLTSSRSHALLTLTFEIESQVESGQTLISRSKLNLIDLAGSEKLPFISSASDNNPKHVKELSAINKSLSALGNVISALASSTRTHIPYRDSKLTRILQDSLGGNTRTVLIACIAPTILHTMETMSTLQFAERAKNIKLSVKANTLVDDKVTLAKAQAEITRLKALLSHAMKQIEEKNGGGDSSNLINASEFERLVVENDKLKQENITLKRLAKTHSLASFDDMSVQSRSSRKTANRSPADPRSSQHRDRLGRKPGFLSGANRFTYGKNSEFFGAGAGGGGGSSSKSDIKKNRSPLRARKSSSSDWESDSDREGERGVRGGLSKRSYESPSAFIRRQQQSYSKEAKQQSKFHNKLFKAINDRQVAELNILIEDAQRKLIEQQQQQQLQQQQQFMPTLAPSSNETQQQHQMMMMMQPQWPMGYMSQPMAGNYPPGMNTPGNIPQPVSYGQANGMLPMFPKGGNLGPIPYPTPSTMNAYPFQINGMIPNSLSNMSPIDPQLEHQSEFLPLGEDEGKHIPIIAISSRDQQQSQLVDHHSSSSNQGGYSNRQQPSSSSSSTKPPLQPVVKQPIPEPIEPPVNRIFLRKSGNSAGSNGNSNNVTNHGFTPNVGHGSNGFVGGSPNPLPKLTPVPEDNGSSHPASGTTSLFASAVNMYSNASKASHILTDMVRNIGSRNNSNKSDDQGVVPVSLTSSADDIGRAIEMFSFRFNAWDRIDILDYEPSKRLHKCQFPNGSIQWLDLTKKPIRSMQ